MYPPTHIQWPRMAISGFYCHSWYKQINWQIYPQYWHLVVKMTLSFLELQKSPLVSFQGAEHNGKGLKDLPYTISEILSTVSCGQDDVQIWQKVAVFVPRAPAISTSKFSGVLNTMAKWSRWDSPNLLRSTLDLPADVPPYSHLVAKNGNFRFLLSQLI